MNIAFKFKYIHTNGLFTRLSKRIAALSPIPVHHYKEEDVFIIEASGNQKELEELAELVSSLVPQSLFLQETSVSETGEINWDTKSEELNTHYEIPYCIECQNQVIQSLNPFSPCSVCGFSEKSLTRDNNISNPQEYFSQLAEKIIEGEEVELETYNGIRRFSLLKSQEKENTSILICNPENISNYFSITQGELNALMLVEKPSVRLKPKVLFHHENTLQKPMYPVFFADDKITLALSAALSKKGVFALYCDNPTPLRVTSSLGEYFIIKSARDMLPWKHPYENTSNKSLCSICLSKEHTSEISSYSSKVGSTSMVEFLDDALTSPKKMLEEIYSMDEAGERVIENFQNRFPKLYADLLDIEPKNSKNSSMMAKLWAMAAYFTGLTKTDNIVVACECLEAAALEFQGKSGPRIDYKVTETQSGYALDPRVAIRSAMSFKLAGVDDYLLSFGFIDSLADFIAQQAEFADANISIQGVVLSGSLFENHQLLMRTYNSITPNYTIYRDKKASLE